MTQFLEDPTPLLLLITGKRGVPTMHLKYSPFDRLIENKKFQNAQLQSPGGSDFIVILRTFPAEFEDKM